MVMGNVKTVAATVKNANGALCPAATGFWTGEAYFGRAVARVEIKIEPYIMEAVAGEKGKTRYLFGLSHPEITLQVKR